MKFSCPFDFDCLLLNWSVYLFSAIVFVCLHLSRLVLRGIPFTFYCGTLIGPSFLTNITEQNLNKIYLNKIWPCFPLWTFSDCVEIILLVLKVYLSLQTVAQKSSPFSHLSNTTTPFKKKFILFETFLPCGVQIMYNYSNAICLFWCQFSSFEIFGGPLWVRLHLWVNRLSRPWLRLSCRLEKQKAL